MAENENEVKEEPVHKRRVRYKGKYPKKFNEKYKELNPDKYKDEAEKVTNKGKTPAGTHIPIMVNEILEFLDIQPGQVGYDATLGYGGHTTKMLEKLGGEGHLYATDVDMIESVKTEERLRNAGYGEDIFTIKRINFRNIDQVADEKFDFVLADLGVSSMQIDNPERGFSFKFDGPLDLRLNPTEGKTAAERLLELSYFDLVDILTENSDEPYAKEISSKIMDHLHKENKPIETTRELYDVVEEALSFIHTSDKKDIVKKTCQRVFQALRIEVNSEFEVLHEFMEKLPNCVKPGGRIAILTFHSGEDRIVKKAFKQGCKDGIYSSVARDVIRPTMEECFKNPRAKSTKMRWAVKA